jgi:ketosteroid isomerase-like protein
MSEENVDRYRRNIEALNRRDVEALLPELDPEIEWNMPLQRLLGGEAAVYHGHEGVREYFRDMGEAFAEIRVDYPDIRDLGDRVLAIGSFQARGRESGVPIESPLGAVLEMRDGKVIRARTYFDPKEALEAVGLGK